MRSPATRAWPTRPYLLSIPSVENPSVLEAVIVAGREYGVTVNRVSLGSAVKG